ncbi:hypothetical protein BTUL_0053g00440 [Botrytis tulipae]|uniref:Uncharacterized protein n=1 Tax=Botrytis tulipae TaxID=87230 RepID=A0A4Z1EQH0_9HELO|nr:hypothetical protein BTUL_0053g00440 [Botrytis tulipae]
MTAARTNLDGFGVPELGFPLLLLIIINTKVARFSWLLFACFTSLCLWKIVIFLTRFTPKTFPVGRNGDYRENADVGLYSREIQVSIMPIE